MEGSIFTVNSGIREGAQSASQTNHTPRSQKATLKCNSITNKSVQHQRIITYAEGYQAGESGQEP